jgi:hypothetical protein
LHPAWNEPRSPAKSAEGANIIFASIERATIKPWDDTLYGTRHDRETLDSLSAPWLELLPELDAN